MSDIFDEVEEDLRRARFEALWSKYWPSILTVAVIVIAGVGGWRFYDWQQDQKSAAAGARFEAAMRVSRTDGAEAEKQFAAIATDAPSGYRILARFRQATELAVRDKDGAVKAFDALAADPCRRGRCCRMSPASVRPISWSIPFPRPKSSRRVEPLAGPAQGLSPFGA